MTAGSVLLRLHGGSLLSFGSTFLGITRVSVRNVSEAEKLLCVCECGWLYLVDCSSTAGSINSSRKSAVEQNKQTNRKTRKRKKYA